LLDDEERRLFRTLSVFAGSCNYEGAEVVCDADPDTLQSLIDKSLLRRREEHGQTRYWMLETIRELAVQRSVDAGEDVELRRRHAHHYLALAVSSNLAADAEGEMKHYFVIPERDNLRAALAWALEAGETAFGLELVVALENYWATSLPAEGFEWATAFLDQADDVDGMLVSRGLRVRGGMANALGQLDASEQSWVQALAIARELDDDRAVAILLHRLSNTAMRRDDPGRARELAEESLAGHRRSGGWPKVEAQALGTLAWVARSEGNPERALELLRESCALADKAGFRWWLSGMLANAGLVSMEVGDIADARASVEQALGLSHAMHDRPGTVYELRVLAEIAAGAGDDRLAGTLVGAAAAENERLPVGRWIHEWRSLPAEHERASVEFEAGRAEGRELSLDDAVAFALAETYEVGSRGSR
jgi:non-specific serine/threonine protein kinase